MELKLSEEDVKRILIEWAAAKFPVVFDEVDFDASYGTLRSVTLSQEAPEDAQS